MVWTIVKTLSSSLVTADSHIMNEHIVDNRYQSPNLPGGTIKHACSAMLQDSANFYSTTYRTLRCRFLALRAVQSGRR
ncbi:hypothetical protein M422DRAFT_265783 [Sphaerobolus stellatus SS14]|uniref:Uncharacterized protein n=1 Tax=Sphaerobolus stellatus (strain SS14) TaxID=990650 RepID=A0A0C9TQQ2_SPHS4|nr:hypothetical protein M422DRAFT_265783 [Sphaerobolus stellatus SS14]